MAIHFAQGPNYGIELKHGTTIEQTIAMLELLTSPKYQATLIDPDDKGEGGEVDVVFPGPLFADRVRRAIDTRTGARRPEALAPIAAIKLLPPTCVACEMGMLKDERRAERTLSAFETFLGTIGSSIFYTDMSVNRRGSLVGTTEFTTSRMTAMCLLNAYLGRRLFPREMREMIVDMHGVPFVAASAEDEFEMEFYSDTNGNEKGVLQKFRRMVSKYARIHRLEALAMQPFGSATAPWSIRMSAVPKPGLIGRQCIAALTQRASNPEFGGFTRVASVKVKNIHLIKLA
jgi:hypothetical protein